MKGRQLAHQKRIVARDFFRLNAALSSASPTRWQQNISGGNLTGPVAAKMENCTRIISQQSHGERRELLESLQREAGALISKLPTDQQEEVAENLELLVKGADEKKPNRRWYSVSAEGLLEASKLAKDLTSNLVGTIGQLGKLIRPDFALPEAKAESKG